MTNYDQEIYKIVAREEVARYLDKNEQRLSFGASSLAILYAAMSESGRKELFSSDMDVKHSYPIDPSDFCRCLRLSEEHPLIAFQGLQSLANVKFGGDIWGRMSRNMDLIHEVLNIDLLFNEKRAPSTYHLMKCIIEGTELSKPSDYVDKLSTEQREFMDSFMKPITPQWIVSNKNKIPEYEASDITRYKESELNNESNVISTFRLTNDRTDSKMCSIGVVIDEGIIMIHGKTYKSLLASNANFSAFVSEDGCVLVADIDGESLRIDRNKQIFYSNDMFITMRENSFIIPVEDVKLNIIEKTPSFSTNETLIDIGILN